MLPIEYSYTLCMSLSLLLFFGVSFIVGRLPDRDIFKKYRRSRTIMGCALLLLSANYLIHLTFSPRFTDSTFAIFINLCTYSLAAWFFGSALVMLLVKNFVTQRRFIWHIAGWFVYVAVATTLFLLLPKGQPRTWLLIGMAAAFMAYCSWLGTILLRAYRHAVRTLDDYYSDEIAVYIRWMSVFTYWAVGYGISQGFLTFIPDRYVVLWLLSAIPFFIYLYVSYKHYVLFYEKVDVAIENDEEREDFAETDFFPPSADEPAEDEQEDKKLETLTQAYSNERIAEGLERWIQRNGFTQNGLTLADLAHELYTNRTYLSTYINGHFHMSFREWIGSLRLSYAKNLLLKEPNLSVGKVAQRAGYQSLSHFTSSFTKSEGQAPSKWRKEAWLAAADS
ncbi:helix-turn-helix domain-containing protein [Prevotella falsenii]